MNNFFDIISPSAIAVIVIFVILFVTALLIVICKLDNISFRQNRIEESVCETKELISNVVQGSKRIERNVDAINQRTRAEKNKKSSSSGKYDKRGANGYEGKASKNNYKKNTGDKRSSNSSISK